jgi:hypothetical protein
MAGEAEESFFESGCGSLAFESGRSIERDELAVAEDSDAVGEKLNFRERVRRKEKRGCAGLQDLRFQEVAEGRGGDGVQAARWLVEKEDGRGVKQRASEAEALNGAGRKGAHLAIERFGEFELRSELSDAIAHGGCGKMIEAAEEEEIFASGEARVKALVRAGVVAERTANGARRSDGIMAGDGGGARGGEQERRKNTDERRFAGAVCAEKGDGFADVEFERDALQGGQRWSFERLQKSAPT